MINKILVLGVGPMAEEYLTACQNLSIQPEFVGRSVAGMKRFEAKTGVRPHSSLEGLTAEDFLGVVVAVNEASLSAVLIEVLRRGFKRVLVEKPGGSSLEHFQELSDEVSKYPAKVFVAYNRRFYSTVAKLNELANDDGGLVSIHFDFTERVHIVAELEKDRETKEDWFFQNSSHVIDLVLFLAPGTEIIESRSSGGLPWHPRASHFSGFGWNRDGVHITYNSVWGARGGWEVIARSNTTHFRLKPLEVLEVTRPDGAIESYREEEITEHSGKAGITGMLLAFTEVASEDAGLLTWSEQVHNVKIYRAILDGVRTLS